MERGRRPSQVEAWVYSLKERVPNHPGFPRTKNVSQDVRLKVLTGNIPCLLE